MYLLALGWFVFVSAMSTGISNLQEIANKMLVTTTPKDEGAAGLMGH